MLIDYDFEAAGAKGLGGNSNYVRDPAPVVFTKHSSSNCS